MKVFTKNNNEKPFKTLLYYLELILEFIFFFLIFEDLKFNS